MNVTEVTGPGVTPWLVNKLQEWGFVTLTEVQTFALQAGVANGNSLVISAPTSSGKTLIGEIAVLSATQLGVRAIYLVSHKALADQKYLDFVNRFGELAANPLASVGLNTGDRAEGDVDAQILVATYEKALGLVLTGQLKLNNTLIVADELQILGELGRGPDIEALCAIVRKQGVRQFLALTATVENPEDLAGWMQCNLVRSAHRDVPLHQEVWNAGRAYLTTFGQEEGREVYAIANASGDVLGAVTQLLNLGRGPVLVFTESRREASDYATAFGQARPRVGEGIALAAQLDLFSEPTDASEQLRNNAERRVTFHTADLSSQERQVIESGFTDSKFEVCFATSTLAAGVNFPFRTIVFPKLTFQWGDRAGAHIPRSDYRNMSGRAGRLGMHQDGYAVLLPRNSVELAYANKLVLPDNDQLNSQLIGLSLRKSILTFVSSGLVNNFAGILTFFENTLYWCQILDKNPAKLTELEGKSQIAVEWLVANHLLLQVDGVLSVTPVGRGAALSGLLPTTAVQLATMLYSRRDELAASFEDWIPGLIYAVCASDEFRAQKPSRYFPYPSKTSYDSVTFWSTKNLPIPLDRADKKLAQCAHAMFLYIEGVAERKIAYATHLSSGSVHRLAIDVAWMLDGLHKLSCVPDLNCSQGLSNQIGLLGRRVRWGAPAEVLDMLRVAERQKVPGFGRQRAMALIANGIATLQDILAATRERLSLLLHSEPRAQALQEAVSGAVGLGPSRLVETHHLIASKLGIQSIVERCNRELGVEYEVAIADLLRIELSWTVTVLDDGTRQNVPDLLLELGSYKVLLECKTCSKSPPLIKKEEAWAVLQKAADFDSGMRRVTLGKPYFDETSKKKAAASSDITLVEHTAFLEAVLRVHSGTLASEEFIKWLSALGVAEMERLGGMPTYVD